MRGVVWAGVACIAVILVVGGWKVMAANVLHGDVTPRKLYVSVTNVSGGGDPFDDSNPHVCDPELGRLSTWRCDVADPAGSGGGVLYRVKIEGDSSCWHATGEYRGGEGHLPRRISGCVHIQED
jgi:hypothetical protein